MTFLVVAMLLAVVQASPPVPGKAADNAAGRRGDIKSDATTEQKAAANSSSPGNPVQSPTPKGNSEDIGNDDAANSVRISKLPAVSVVRDWADWGSWIFNGLLVAIGGFQVWLLFRTWKTMKRQSEWMRRQTIILSDYNKATRDAADATAKSAAATERSVGLLEGQLEQMQKQAGEMEKQTMHLDGSVAAAKKSAEAAKLSADVVARISIPTLVIEKFEAANAGTASLTDMLRYPDVHIVIKNYGQTPALLKFWNIVFTCEELPSEPDYWNHKGSGIMLERDVIEPNQPYTIPPINS